jgi:hypothetical protein
MVSGYFSLQGKRRNNRDFFMRFRSEENRKGFELIKNLIPDIVSELNLENPFFVGLIQEKWENIKSDLKEKWDAIYKNTSEKVK